MGQIRLKENADSGGRSTMLIKMQIDQQTRDLADSRQPIPTSIINAATQAGIEGGLIGAAEAGLITTTQLATLITVVNSSQQAGRNAGIRLLQQEEGQINQDTLLIAITQAALQAGISAGAQVAEIQSQSRGVGVFIKRHWIKIWTVSVGFIAMSSLAYALLEKKGLIDTLS